MTVLSRGLNVFIFYKKSSMQIFLMYFGISKNITNQQVYAYIYIIK